MSRSYYIGLDIHNKVIAFCIKTFDGQIIDNEKINADRKSVHEWASELPDPGLVPWRQLSSLGGYMIS